MASVSTKILGKRKVRSIGLRWGISFPLINWYRYGSPEICMDQADLKSHAPLFPAYYVRNRNQRSPSAQLCAIRFQNMKLLGESLKNSGSAPP